MLAEQSGYLRMPTVAGELVAFVCEDDLWAVPTAGGTARRLTANLAAVARPQLSPDGRWVAFTSREEHHPEVWVMAAGGGPARRLTWWGAPSTTTVGWTSDGRVAAVSSAGQPFVSHTHPYAVDPEHGRAERLPFGPCLAVGWQAGGPGVLLGRHSADAARWKRYRGGTAGQLWVDPRGTGAFRRILADLAGNLVSPMWAAGRIYFLSDHEGIGNLYSCRPTGADVRRHSDHGAYYARFATTDGQRIVYQCAAELWCYQPGADAPRRIEVDQPSPRVQRNRKFVPADRHLQDYAVHPSGKALAVQSRGQLFTFPLWEEHVRPVGPRHGVRHRLAQWLADGESLVAVSDATGEERLVVYAPDGAERVLADADLGIAWELAPSPTADLVAVANNRHELLLADLGAGTVRRIDASEHGQLAGPVWSPDGRWLAYSIATTASTASIKVWDARGGVAHPVTRAEFRDFSPSWDPKGEQLFFLSTRVFDPVVEPALGILSLPQTVKAYAVPLGRGARSPFWARPRGFADSAPATPSPGGTDAAPPEVSIDFDGIDRRAVEFPLPVARYLALAAIPGKVLLLSAPLEANFFSGLGAGPAPAFALECFDLAEAKSEPVTGGVASFALSRDGSTLVYRAGDRLRAVPAGKKPPEGAEAEGPPGRRNGWLDLGRLRVAVDPDAEWRQMFREAWRLQRECFWVPDMSGVDWARVYDRYAPLLAKVGCRSELADLIWEMQGELGTSHAYELGGDYRPAPDYAMGFLGADLEPDGRTGRWRIAHIVRADHWSADRGSPLEAPGVDIAEGATLLAVNGAPPDARTPPAAHLVHQAGLAVELTIGDARGRKPRRVVVSTLRDESPLRYREWVERNRARVREETGGRAGYLHLPDMMMVGFAEFHRAYQAEVVYDGLVVDARDNGGGFVSGLILAQLARARTGAAVGRHHRPVPFPDGAPAGPMVCLTNQNAGSDGDIFPYCFKALGLGPVIGTRTWGGVIGINPRGGLADGGITTQPTTAIWLAGAGWGVENHGVVPDVEVDLTPADWAAGRDPQLARGIAALLAILRRHHPAAPDLERRPRLTLPTLPPR